MKTGKLKILLFVLAAVLGILAALAVTCAFSVMKTQGESMEPSIEKGEIIVINKLAYFFQEPKVGDAAAFHCSVYSEDGEGSTLIKRIVATEGDQVEIKDGMLYVNDKIYIQEAAAPVYMEAMEKVIIGKGKVFVLSDNRGAVLDSRDQAVGQLDISELMGKVCFK
ncbi:signal peptidase I [Clostridiales bacterium]|nr:signal peptidase I [Clostridiales bacterium]